MAEYEIKDGVGIIPEGTTTIVKNAFSRDCKELTSIVIPENLHSLIVELPAEKKAASK